MTNYLSNYDYVESTAFEGIMPAAAEKLGVVGDSEVSVHMHGFEAKGVDALEVVDVEGILADNSSADAVEPSEEPSEEPVEEPAE